MKKKNVQETLKCQRVLPQTYIYNNWQTVCVFHTLEVFSCVLPYQEEYV